jgi:hypothetical protein
MKNRKIIRFIFSAVMLFTTLSCFIFPFSQLNAETNRNNSSESQVTSLTTPLENSLLSSQSASVPAPSLTILTGGSPVNGLNKKHFNPAFSCNVLSELSFYKFYLNESAQNVLTPVQLHLAFCVLRI